MASIESQVNDMFAGLFQKHNIETLRQRKTEAEKDPLAHKLTRVMVNTSYKYYEVMTTKTRRVRFCYSQHRNAAGFFLGWREVMTGGQGRRDMWVSRRVKRRVMEIALRRYNALRNKKAQPTPQV